MGMVWTRRRGSLSWAWASCAPMGANMRQMTMNIACLLFIGDLQILMRDLASESQVDVAAPEQQIATPIAKAWSGLLHLISILRLPGCRLTRTKSKWHGSRLRD